MLKALFKKQFLELNAVCFQDRKSGKRRSRKSTILFIALYVILFLYLGAAFYLTASSLVPLAGTENGWLYYSLMGSLSLLLGVLGGAFNTYAGLYHAKDNDLLLSMPLPFSRILLVRISGVAATALLYGSLVFVPAMLCRFFYPAAPVGLGGVVSGVLTWLLLILLITTLSCAFGWVVALIASRLKNNSLLTVLLSLILIAVYYLGVSRSYTWIGALLTDSNAVSQVMRTWLYPLYLLGQSAEGDLLSLLLLAAIALGLFVLTWQILSRSFLRITTRKDAAPKAIYRAAPARAASADRALFRKEWRRFTSSATYMLNCGLGSVFMLCAAVAALLYRDMLSELVGALGELQDLLPFLLAAIVCSMSATNDVTAPSISLEGKSLWLLQVMPVDGGKVFRAKQLLHWVITMPSALLLALALSFAAGLEWYGTVLLCVTVILFIRLHALLGLVLNLHFPSLNWTNETVPIKQSISVGITLMGGMAAALLLLGGGGYLLTIRWHLPLWQGMLALLAVLALILWGTNRWLMEKGLAIFRSL